VGTAVSQSSSAIKNRKGRTQMMTLFATRRCPYCHKTGSIMVDENELFLYLRGEYVQRAFSSLSVPLREQIVSGLHPECWQELFGSEITSEYESESQ